MTASTSRETAGPCYCLVFADRLGTRTLLPIASGRNDYDVDVWEFVHECADLLLRPDHERTIRAATTTTMDSCEALWDAH